jgi:hypothetical protein
VYKVLTKDELGNYSTLSKDKHNDSSFAERVTNQLIEGKD